MAKRVGGYTACNDTEESETISARSILAVVLNSGVHGNALKG